MTTTKLQADSGGLSHLGVAKRANDKAMDAGVRLAGICGNVWPAKDDVFRARVEGQIIENAFEFAFFARQVLDFEWRTYQVPADVKIPVECLWQINLEKPLNSLDLRKACNKLVHSEHIVAISWAHGNSRFTALGDRRFSHLELRSDAKTVFHVCPYSMVYAYLARKDHYPKGSE